MLELKVVEQQLVKELIIQEVHHLIMQLVKEQPKVLELIEAYQQVQVQPMVQELVKAIQREQVLVKVFLVMEPIVVQVLQQVEVILA
jgi:hypothetical protein